MNMWSKNTLKLHFKISVKENENVDAVTVEENFGDVLL